MILNINKITKNYSQGGKELCVLKDLTLEIETAKSIAILGKSGSGKSTFLSIVAGLDRPTSGEIKIFNEDIASKDENDLAIFRAKNIGIIFQQFHLMQNLTALENVMLPLEILGDKESKAKAIEALEKVELDHRMHHFPNELSGGEKQRVAIARSIVTKPNIILADEPSGNLDVETGKTVMDFLFKLVKDLDTTLVLVTHDQELADQCAQIYHLVDHKLELQ